MQTNQLLWNMVVNCCSYAQLMVMCWSSLAVRIATCFIIKARELLCGVCAETTPSLLDSEVIIIVEALYHWSHPIISSRWLSICF